ncbi:MAG: integration host factor subunit beta [Gammaproteobacteria bacterium]|nr:integration host factor subunit beta [Gammaproteobacteria bacterium]
MTKSDLIDHLTRGQLHLSPRDIESSVNSILEHMTQSLIDGDRIEIRGFGSIGLRYRAPRLGRNPKTGAAVHVDAKYVPHFKPGRMLRERVNHGLTGTNQPAAPGDPITR